MKWVVPAIEMEEERWERVHSICVICEDNKLFISTLSIYSISFGTDIGLYSLRKDNNIRIIIIIILEGLTDKKRG